MTDTAPLPSPVTLLPSSGEKAASALGVHAQTSVEAKWKMALARPRDLDAARQRMLFECRDPAFADNKSTLYSRPVGGGESATGLGIRFAEAALRCFGNLLCETQVIYDDPEMQIKRVGVIDLETNATVTEDCLIRKEVERKYLKKGQAVISERLNSKGDKVFLVHATEQEAQNKVRVSTQKATRNAVLALLPFSVKEECVAMIESIRADEAAKDPSQSRKAMVDAFHRIHVEVEDLTEFMGKALNRLTPKEVAELRRIHDAIASEETTWDEVMEGRQPAQHADEVRDGFDDRSGMEFAGGLVVKDKEEPEEITAEDEVPFADPVLAEITELIGKLAQEKEADASSDMTLEQCRKALETEICQRYEVKDYLDLGDMQAASVAARLRQDLKMARGE